MDPGGWSEHTTVLFGGCAAEDATGSSRTFHPHEDLKSISGYNNRGEAASSFLHPSPPETDAPWGDSTGRRNPEGCRLHNSRQAKRARVENIIRGMTGSPSTFERTDYEQGKERFGEPSLVQDLMGGRGQSWTRRQVKGQLRKQFYRNGETRGNGMESYPTWQPLPLSPSHAFPESFSELEDRFRKTTTLQSKPERVKLMADVLKYELSRAVSRSVDSVFKNVPFLQTSPNHEGEQTEVPLHSTVCAGEELGHSLYGNEMVQTPDVQTEALSLVVQKPCHETLDKFLHPPNWKVLPDPAVSFSQDYAYANPSDAKVDADARWFQGGNPAKVKTFDARWTSVKVRSKVKARSVRSSQSVEATLSDGLCFPQVKIECDTLVKNNNLYVFNEGLTTKHLKKAKLMFFYTRYPSSAVLRLCFHDVKFTRCITSQLIKWFSNFREFFYIQMEKFARQAVVGGASDVRALTVERQSQLFNTLNVHYNKGGDFQVPDRFLEVAEITLREFYISITMGKDRDPSWKKAIYKVICKLDSDVPDQFKSHHLG